MEDMGREMVKYCAGLPLAIVILGGILVTKPSFTEWEKVYNDSLSSLKKGKGLGENQQEQLFDILVRSYNALPPQLKPCFLYLSKFMEDEWIDAETLYQLWIAEGMVLSSEKREGETMMQVAESYMGELVHRSMVQVRFNDLESSLTKFNSCSLHDLMRDLSLFQAKADEFFETIDLRGGNGTHPNSSGVSQVAKTRQLVVYHERGITTSPYFFKKPNHQQYRSILHLNIDSYESLSPPPGSYLANFKLLRVLALENIRLGRQEVLGIRCGIGRVLGSLVYLRYLSLRGSNLKNFSWIHKLVLLQTLKLDNYNNHLMSPVSSNVLGKLAYLRHLYLPEWSHRNSRKLRFNGMSKLETLENFNNVWCEFKDLPKLSSLRRLKLKVFDHYDKIQEMFEYLSDIALSSNTCIQYLALGIWILDGGFLNDPDMIRQLLWDHKFNLQELSINGQLPELAELSINLTYIDASFTGITKLKLRESCLEEDPMPVLEKIPTLRDLDLGENTYKGKAMVCSAIGFPRLTRLCLWDLGDLEKWKVEEGSMHILEHLEIYNCPNLEELSEGLIYLTSLRTLILREMPSKFYDRVLLENGEQGPDFYKVAHVPDLIIDL
ncbi:putative disease resistance protein RXW24L isoform X1 [Apium graveolens]|uniref:putative disease resistance protein RXW24L isoform X1 n=1 Tax=Apium graveolens TaxID=4045 RepID=UPI003D7AE943